MTASYPLPSYAAHIWLSGDEIHLSFPSPLDAPSHTVHFPANERGLKVALQVLRSREEEARGEGSFLGHRGAPPQYDIEALYRSVASSEPAKRLEASKAEIERERAEAEEFLAELGL